LLELNNSYLYLVVKNIVSNFNYTLEDLGELETIELLIFKIVLITMRSVILICIPRLFLLN